MTNESGSIQSNILQELKKTGFPTEVICAEIMQKSGWGVLHNPSYFDDSEKISREFDLQSYKQWKYPTKGGDYFIGIYLIVECKKSEKPWVFFSTPEAHGISPSGFIKTSDEFIFSGSYPVEGQISDDVLRKKHHYFYNNQLARTFYEPFKGQENSGTSQMIYSAIMSSVKATLFHLQDRNESESTSIYYPIIIFNGNMFTANVLSLDDIELVPSEHVQLSFNYMLPKSRLQSSIGDRQERFIIDIVHYEYLEKFLHILDKEHSEIVQDIQSYHSNDSE